MMNRRKLVAGLIGAPMALRTGLALGADSAQAQARKDSFKVYMVVWRGETQVEKGFKDYFQKSGLKVDYVLRSAGQRMEPLAGFAQEINQAKPDLVYVFSTDAAVGLVGTYDTTTPELYVSPDIPVVFAGVGGPVNAHIVRALDKPGRNVTGVIHLAPVDVQLKAMQSFMPIKRLGVMYNRAEAYGRFAARETMRLCEEQKIDLVLGTPVDEHRDPQRELITPVLEEIAKAKPDLVYVPSTSFFAPHAKHLTDEALRLRLPTFSGVESLMQAGRPMMGLVSPFYGVGQFAGFKAEQILKGQRRADQIPVETLTRFSFIINIGVARELELYPPMAILKYAQIIGK